MVKLQVQRGDLRAVRGDLVFVPLPEGDVRAAVRRLDRRLATALARRLGAGAFRGRTDELLVHHGERTTAFLGIGRAPVADDAWRRAGARARQEAERQRARRVAVYLGENGASREVLAAFGEGFLLAGYRFGRYLSNDDGQRCVGSSESGPCCASWCAPSRRERLACARRDGPPVDQLRERNVLERDPQRLEQRDLGWRAAA